MIRQLHALRIAELAQSDQQSSKRRRLSTAGALDDDTAAVTSVAPEAGEQRFNYVTVGGYATLAAITADELAGASNIGAVPYGTDGQADPQRDGYYVVDERRTNRPIAASDAVERLDIRLTKEGTRGSHWRAVTASPTVATNPFGSDGGAELGIHAAAEKVRWFDHRGNTGALEDATVQRTVGGERGPIDIYDATEPSFDEPSLIYTLPYTLEYEADVHLWDDYDRSKTVTIPEGGATVGSDAVGSATIGSSNQALRWPRVYATDHDYVGSPVAETGRLRLHFDEGRGQISASRWNDSDATYEAVQLDPASDWRLYDVDVTHVSLGRLTAQVEFEDTSASALTTHNLNCTLARGYEAAIWTVPENGSSPPQGLIDRVDAIASPQERLPMATTGLIERSAVNE